ncbi:hypothetical protein CCAX7_26870 [Capsulimonas corticalis]|uniref:Uncharacterized protein n=1 Tax=Capsulimonas corticalis TaxID=2219043 RepID=A0A402CTT4_9BACT|nr:hypothetical protein [Capsulimonas corticalis]BDI30636.1 hypothetical protein CCAX7_26870 [Capsulimonas corticalis]
MITIYHNLDYHIATRLMAPEEQQTYQPSPHDLELAAIVPEDDLSRAFHRTLHEEGVAWTSDRGVTIIGDPRTRRSTYDGDVLVDADGAAYLVLPVGFRALPTLRLPFLGPERLKDGKHVE